MAARNEVRLALARAAERREKTSALAKGRAEAAREKIRSWAETVEIRVPTMSLAEATERAIAAYNEFNRERSGLAASSASDSAFLDRITLYFLRHRCTNYERLLDATFGKVGTGEAYDILRSRIIDAIVEVYPQLAIAAAEQYLRTTFREG